MTEFEKNQQVADQICDTLTWRGRQFKLGQYVALLDGEVIAVEEDALDAIVSQLRARDPNPDRGMVFQVGPPVMDVIR